MKAATFIGFAQASVILDKFMLHSYPKAVCNDGSPAGYYFKRSETDSNDWLIF